MRERKLTDDQVREIFLLRQQGRGPVEIARRYNVGYEIISGIINGHTYKDVLRSDEVTYEEAVQILAVQSPVFYTMVIQGEVPFRRMAKNKRAFLRRDIEKLKKKIDLIASGTLEEALQDARNERKLSKKIMHEIQEFQDDFDRAIEEEQKRVRKIEFLERKRKRDRLKREQKRRQNIKMIEESNLMKMRKEDVDA